MAKQTHDIEDSPELRQAQPIKKQPRRINTSIRNILAQREKAIAVRDQATAEVKNYDAALIALGWMEQLTLQ
jgi:hypothetical protein